MTPQSFRNRLRDEYLFLHSIGQEATWADVICVVPEWHKKWAEALLGRYDA